MIQQRGRKRILISLGVITITILVLLIAYLFIIKPSPQEDSSEIANPAANYCTEQGYKYEIRKNDSGQYGVCILNDSECEEWSFFRGECILK